MSLGFYLKETQKRHEAMRELVRTTPEPVLSEVLATLNSHRQREVVEMRCGLYGEAMTQAAIGREWGLTAGRIQQIEARALRKLEHPSRRRRLGGGPK